MPLVAWHYAQMTQQNPDRYSKLQTPCSCHISNVTDHTGEMGTLLDTTSETHFVTAILCTDGHPHLNMALISS